MPQPMAPSTIRKQIAAAIMPAELPPTIWSESAETVWALPPPRMDRARRPTANSAGRPAPAIRASTRICHKADQLIHGGMRVGGAAMSNSPSLSGQARDSGRGGLGLGGLARGDRALPVGVHVVVADPGLARPDPDVPGHRDQQDEVDDHAAG